MMGITALGFVLSSYCSYAFSTWPDYFGKNSHLRIQNAAAVIQTDFTSLSARMKRSPANNTYRPLLESTCREAVMCRRDWGNLQSLKRFKKKRYSPSPYLMARSARGCLRAISFDIASTAGSRLLFDLNGFAMRSTTGRNSVEKTGCTWMGDFHLSKRVL
jgi:hypothetical protein